MSASAAFMDLYSRRLWINRFNLAVSLLTIERERAIHDAVMSAATVILSTATS